MTIHEDDRKNIQAPKKNKNPTTKLMERYWTMMLA